MAKKILNYNSLDANKLKEFHTKGNNFIIKCQDCNNSYIYYDDNNNLVTIFEYDDNIDIFLNNYNKNLIKDIKIINNKFDKDININIPVINEKVDDIVKILSNNGYKCVNISYESKNNVLFKVPMIIISLSSKNKCNSSKIYKNIKEKFAFQSKDKIYFSKSDKDKLKKLLKLNYESGGKIKKLDKGNYKLVGDIKKGDEDQNIFLEPTEYNFHTHPAPFYKYKENQSFAGWFSAVDIEYILYNSLYGLKEHFLITPEGIYRLRLTKEFREKFKNLNETCQTKVVNKISKIFEKLERKRTFKTKNILQLNNDTLPIFNEFFIFVNSLNVSNLPICFPRDSNFILFDIDFEFW